MSIGCYRRALRVCDRTAHPEGNAALHINLGNVFLSLPAPNETVSLRNAFHALRHFRHALEVRGAGREDKQYATNQLDLAQAYLRLARLESAIDCLQEAYRVFMACGDALCAERVRQQLARVHRARTMGTTGDDSATRNRGATQGDENGVL